MFKWLFGCLLILFGMILWGVVHEGAKLAEEREVYCTEKGYEGFYHKADQMSELCCPIGESMSMGNCVTVLIEE